MTKKPGKDDRAAYSEWVWKTEMRSLYESGISQRGIAALLNQKKVRTPFGKSWHSTSVGRMLERYGASSKGKLSPKAYNAKMRRAYAGDREAQEQITRFFGIHCPPTEEHERYYELLDRTLAGGRRARKQLAEALEFEDPKARTDAEMWARLFEIKNEVDAANFDDVEGLLAEAAEQGSCFLVQAHGIAAQRARMADDYAAATAHLETAQELAEECEDGSCRADLARRRANLYGAQTRYEEALLCAEEAVQAYEALGHSGHDLDGAGLAKSFRVHAEVLFSMKRHHEAAADFKRSLAMLHPEQHPNAYYLVVHGLAVALKECGPESQKEAVKLMEKLRTTVFQKSSVRKTPHFAYFSWLQGSLKYKLGGQAERARKMVELALNVFLHRNMPAEARAVLATLGKMCKPTRRSVIDRALVADVVHRYASRLCRLPEGELSRRAVEDVLVACNAAGWDAHEEVEYAIEGLRRVGGSRRLPFLL